MIKKSDIERNMPQSRKLYKKKILNSLKEIVREQKRGKGRKHIETDLKILCGMVNISFDKY
jgi:hypothetical protein